MKTIKFLALFILSMVLCTSAFAQYTNDATSFSQYALTKQAPVDVMSQDKASEFGLLWGVHGFVKNEPVVIGARKKDGLFVTLWVVADEAANHQGIEQMTNNPAITFYSYKDVSSGMTYCFYMNSWNNSVTGGDLDAYFQLVATAIKVTRK
jgi:hypothetical protein